jgi:hypothetical protein
LMKQSMPKGQFENVLTTSMNQAIGGPPFLTII